MKPDVASIEDLIKLKALQDAEGQEGVMPSLNPGGGAPMPNVNPQFESPMPSFDYKFKEIPTQEMPQFGQLMPSPTGDEEQRLQRIPGFQNIMDKILEKDVSVPMKKKGLKEVLKRLNPEIEDESAEQGAEQYLKLWEQEVKGRGPAGRGGNINELSIRDLRNMAIFGGHKITEDMSRRELIGVLKRGTQSIPSLEKMMTVNQDGTPMSKEKQALMRDSMREGYEGPLAEEKWSRMFTGESPQITSYDNEAVLREARAFVKTRADFIRNRDDRALTPEEVKEEINRMTTMQSLVHLLHPKVQIALSHYLTQKILKEMQQKEAKKK